MVLQCPRRQIEGSTPDGQLNGLSRRMALKGTGRVVIWAESAKRGSAYVDQPTAANPQPGMISTMRLITAAAIGLGVGLPIGAGTASRWGGEVGLSILELLAQPAATVAAASIAAIVVAIQAKRGLHSVIEGQNHRAKLEASAREHQARLHRQDVLSDREHEQKVLAAALHGELSALWNNVRNQAILTAAQAEVWKALAGKLQPSDDGAEVEVTVPQFEAPVYQANAARIGLLGPSIAGDVATVFSRTSVTAPKTVKMPTRLAAQISKGMHEGLLDWIWDIGQLSARLGHLQFGTADPGSISIEATKKRWRAQQAASQSEPAE